MQKITDPVSGVYLLVLEAHSSFKITVPKFGIIILKKGIYLYSGSAQRHLPKRIQRHLRKDKKLFWHIDYLLASENISIQKIYVYRNVPKEFECMLVRQLEQIANCSHPVTGFGNSDCNSCNSHLLYSSKRTTHNFSVGKINPVLFFER